jgi:glycogen debranching enzyme
MRLRPRDDALRVSQGRTVLITARDGFIDADTDNGLFVHKTRMLSHYSYQINGEEPELVAESNLEQHSALFYYVISPPTPHRKSWNAKGGTEEVVELRLSRIVGEGLHEDVDLTNYTQKLLDFQLELEVDADFADQEELQTQRQQHGRLTRVWRQIGPGAWELVFDYCAEHHYDHQGDTGDARIHRGLILRIEQAGSPPTYTERTLTFPVQLAPQATWHACISAIATLEGQPLPLHYACRAFGAREGKYDQLRTMFLQEAAAFRAPGSDDLGPLVVRTLQQARTDLAALRLYDLDQAERSWLVAAGLPVYVALFGRDTLITAWQAALISPDLLRGTLAVIPRWQGTRIDEWRDEQPGRMPHQIQNSPLSALNYNPFGRYYGTMSTAGFYSEILFALWIWTGDLALVQSFLEPAVKGMRWLENYGDLEGDGFYEFKTHSTQGLKNQCWKDSGLAIVYEDGSQVPAPIATCEVQGLAYVAKVHLGIVLHALGRIEEAQRLWQQAETLKKRFNETFWWEGEGTFVMGLDPHKRPIHSVDSTPGACLAAGIVEESLVRRTADRLLADDLFSGWGVRTLSARHPAYNPFSYQRGSLWPVENGILALAFRRYGLHEHMHRLCRGLFDAAALFDHQRLPELFAGHPRDADHPFPGLYPQANWPQAWSASATFSLLQALLGVFPFAPLETLVVDPQLPDWLPEITVSGLHVGAANVSIRFYRKADGQSDYEVLEKRGNLHVVRQPSPWSLTTSLGKRLSDVIQSLLPGG